MNESIYFIPFWNLTLILIPVFVLIAIFVKWSLDYKTLLYALVRMIAQLLIIGYFLLAIFNQHSVWLILLILLVMLIAASWIAMRPLRAEANFKLYVQTLGCLIVACIPTLMLVILAVIQLDPWHQPRYLIPLAGMIFANSMNVVSLAAERYFSETKKGVEHIEARNAALQTSLLPLLNSFFAVGLVSLPGMMTGQILSGVSPLIAVRYQIMVMCMLLGSAGIASAIFLWMQQKYRPT